MDLTVVAKTITLLCLAGVFIGVVLLTPWFWNLEKGGPGEARAPGRERSRGVGDTARRG
jgi:hypothetical protein